MRYSGIESWKIKSLNGCYYRQWLGTEALNWDDKYFLYTEKI